MARKFECPECKTEMIISDLTGRALPMCCCLIGQRHANRINRDVERRMHEEASAEVRRLQENDTED